MNHDETYAYLAERFGANRIDRRVQKLKARIERFLYKSSNQDLCILNITLLKDAVTDYFADVARLKDFQGIERINKNKITAYEAYWLLRRKPIQIIYDETSFDKIYPNEEFVTTLIMKDCMAKDPELFNGMLPVRRLSQHVLYFLKYRLTTAQHLELFLEGLNTGIAMGMEYHKAHPIEK